MNLPMLGTDSKMEDSKYQVMLLDKSDKTISPMSYPKINRFFNTIEDRNTFVELFEDSIMKAGGRLFHNKNTSHPSFLTFNIYNSSGDSTYELVVYK